VTPSSGRAASRDLLTLRCELMFSLNERGRLLRSRETDGAIAPRFYLGRGPLYNVWGFRADLPERLVAALARLAGKERALPRVSGHLAGESPWPPPERMEAFRVLLREHGEIRHEYRGPAFRFPEILPDVSAREASGELVRLDVGREADRALLLQSVDGGERASDRVSESSESLLTRADCFAIVRAGRIVSTCWTARFLPGVAAEAGVQTMSGERGQGHALRVLVAWAGAMREAGVEPLFSTDWGNRASRSVAQKLRLVSSGEDLHFG
jgi:hypothetical protein